MIKIINKVPDIKLKRPLDLVISGDLEKKIKDNWNKFIEGQDGYWDGDILAVTNYDSVNNVLEVGRAKYSWLIYFITGGDLKIRGLFVSILFKTVDDYYLIVKNNHNMINIIGGMVDFEDLGDDDFNPDISLRREVMEELNLDLYNKNHISYYEFKYFRVPNMNGNYRFVYRGILNFSKEEFIHYFDDNKGNLDGEILEVLLLTKEEVNLLELDDDNILYLREMMNFE